MSNALANINIPKNPVERRVWICGQLRLKGSSLRQLAAKTEVTHQAMSAALLAPNCHLDWVIAEALGLTAQQLFPERFAENGERIHHTRQQQRTAKRGAAHVQNGKAA